MSALIQLIEGEGEACISSRTISENIGVKHKATVKLINKHKTKMGTLGSVVFKIRPESITGQENHALLNEDQAVFLLTLSRNTERVVEFKLALTKVFSKLRRKQALIGANHAKVEWQQNRELGKYQRREITDTIQTFVDYAKTQGSRNAGYYFTNITNCIQNAIGADDRDEADEDMLHILATAELIAVRVLTGSMAAQLPYKTIFQELKRQMIEFKAMIAVNQKEAA